MTPPTRTAAPDVLAAIDVALAEWFGGKGETEALVAALAKEGVYLVSREPLVAALKTILVEAEAEASFAFIREQTRAILEQTGDVVSGLPPIKAAALPAASPALDVERLARELAFQLYDAAPPKIPGGSPARRQWIGDILAVQIATYVDERLAAAFKAAMDGDDPRLAAESQTDE